MDACNGRVILLIKLAISLLHSIDGLLGIINPTFDSFHQFDHTVCSLRTS